MARVAVAVLGPAGEHEHVVGLVADRGDLFRRDLVSLVRYPATAPLLAWGWVAGSASSGCDLAADTWSPKRSRTTSTASLNRVVVVAHPYDLGHAVQTEAKLSITVGSNLTVWVSRAT